MSLVSALMNHWVVAGSDGSSHHVSKNNGPDGSFKVPTWKHKVIKGKHLLLREKVASTGQQIVKAWCTCFPLVAVLVRPFCLMSTKVCQLAGMHPGLQFLMVNYDEQKEICRRLNVHVLPLFRFYRGAEGRISSFSCTTSTIHKLKDAIKRHGIQPERLASEKGLEESELQSFAPPSTDLPNATADASNNMDGDVDSTQ